MGLMASSPAFAQDVNVQNFEPSSSPYSIWSVDHGRTLGHLDPYAALILNYSSRPLVEKLPNDNEVNIVEAQLPLHFNAGLGVTEWFEFGVGFPLYLVNEVEFNGEDRAGVTVGDLALKAKASFLNAEDSPIGIGTLIDVRLPTGDGEAFVGAGGVSVIPKLLFDAKMSIVTVAANVGVLLQGSEELQNVEVSNALQWGVGAEVETIRGLLTFSGEVYGKNDFSDFAGRSSAPIEGLLGAKLLTSSGFAIGAAAGGGMTPGIGSPAFRTILSLSWADRDSDYDDDGIPNSTDGCPQDREDQDGFEDEDGCPETDNDGDQIEDDKDKCPNEAEDIDSFQDDDGCPDPDDDGDGIEDGQDKCQREAEDLDGFQDEDGCPDLDNDEDGIEDTKDQCKNDVEDFDGFQDEDGCPEEDNDLDGLKDGEDQCPNEPGLKSNNGCPPKEKLVEVTAKQIKISQKVFFETGGSKISADSFNLLDQVALAMKTNPQVQLVEVAGHTDDVGKDDKNLKLSDDRAKSVVKYLVGQGVEPERLKAVGYGETKPIDPRKSKPARARNRRVEFNILTQASTVKKPTESQQPPPQ